MNLTTAQHQNALDQGIELGAVRADLGELPPNIEPGQLEPFTGPGAVPFRPERWNAYSQDGGGYQYQVASGDTVSGLAATYLGSGSRWNEIWAMQSPERKAAGSADAIWVDEWLEMPLEAGDNAKAWNGGTLPGSAGGGEDGGEGGTSSELTETEKAEEKKIPTAVYVIGGAAVLGLLAYLAMRK